VGGFAQNTFEPPVKNYSYPNGAIPTNGANTGVDIRLAVGTHTIVISTTVDAAATKPVMFRFAWSSFNQTLADAVKAAKSAKVAVVFADDNGGNGGTASTLTP
jgi:hypothetical protein